MIGAGVLAGSGVALGLLLVVHGLRPRQRPLADALADLLDPPAAPTRHGVTGTDWRGRTSGRLASLLSGVGVDLGDLDADLRVVGRGVEQHLVEKSTAAVAGLLLPVVLAAVAGLGGVTPPPQLVAIGSLGLAAAGFVLPDVLLRSQAAERRRDFRYALSSYLDLAHIVLAAGAGVETALAYAAEAGDGWAFAELRTALHRSRLAGDSPWAAFQRLGEELDISELREAAASLALAGTHGARVRTSLGARADALRTRDLAEMEGEAEAATERMAVPSVLMVVGFVIFVGFPAVTEILGF